MRSIVFALLMCGVIPFILTRPFLGLLVWSWLGYMNPYRLTYGFAYSFPWVLLVAVVTLISLAISKERKTVPVSAFSVLLFLFLAWTGFTTLFAVAPASADAKFVEFAKVVVMVFVTLMLVNDRRRMDWLVWMIVVSIGFYGLKGGAFTILTGGSHRVFGPPQSFIQDNNGLAQALCLVLPLMRYLQLHSQKRWVRMGLGASMLLTGIAVLGTYSRGGLISLVVVAGALMLKSRKRIALIATGLVIVVAAYQFMPSRWIDRMDTIQHAGEVNTVQTRIQSWEFAANVALHRPLVGGGFDLYQNPATWQLYAPEGAAERAVHSIYFRVLGEQGFPGLILFLALLAVSWRNLSNTRKLTRDSPNQKWAYDLASMTQVGLLGFMTAGFATTLSYFDLTYQIMAMCVLLHGLAVEERTRIDGGRVTATDRVALVNRIHLTALSGRGGGRTP